MFYYIPRTRMLSSAQNHLTLISTRRSVFVEILIFLLVTVIISLPQSVITSLATVIFAFFDEEYVKLLESAMNSGEVDQNAINEFIAGFMERIPPEAYVAILASSGLMIPGGMIYCRGIEKRSFLSMGFNKRGVVSEYLIGILVGAVMISLPVLVCVVTGAATLTFNPNVNPLVIVLFFLAFVLQGMGEEVLFRGYLLMTLSGRNKIRTAIIISSLMFSIMHVSNANFGIIPFINITLFGAFAAVYMLKRGSIWGIGAIHTVWNFMQGNIFGFSVSGNPSMPTVFDCKLGEVGEILSGGDFGIEGGLGATVILLIALVVILAMPAKKNELDEFKAETV